MSHITPDYLKAVSKKLAKRGLSGNELSRELHKIAGIKEPIVIKLKKDGTKTDKDISGLSGGTGDETVSES